MNRATAVALVISLAILSLPVKALAGPRPVWVHDRANPYSRLFAPAAISAAGAPAPLPAAIPTVKCGMTMIPGDPKVDPGFAKKLPKDLTQHSIRAVEKSICR